MAVVTWQSGVKDVAAITHEGSVPILVELNEGESGRVVAGTAARAVGADWFEIFALPPASNYPGLETAGGEQGH